MHLRQALRRTHTRIALTAVAVASVLLLAAGLTALRANTQDNLELMARSLVYNVEPALVFGDRLDAAESLARMVRDEGVAEATVWDARGNVFAQWMAPNWLPCNCGHQLARVLGLKVAAQEVQASSAPASSGRAARRLHGKEEAPMVRREKEGQKRNFPILPSAQGRGVATAPQSGAVHIL